MLPSDDNAHTRAPSNARSVELVLFVVLLLTATTAIEWGFRTHGIQPSQRDTVRLWSARRVAVDDAARPVVFVGSSRIQHAVHPPTLERAFPRRDFFQLAVVGSAPFHLIDRLANNPSFTGVIVCEFYPTYMFGSNRGTTSLIDQWLTLFDARSWIDDLESTLRVALKEHLIVGNVETRPTMLLYHLITRRALPHPAHVRIHASRWQEADFSNYEPTQWTDDGSFRLSEEKIGQRIERLRDDLNRLRSRGGDLVFLRTVTSGNVRALEHELYPRDTHFDRFVEAVGARSIHFEDVPEMGEFECPDGRHLDGEAAPRFTEVLARVLAERDLL